MRMYNVGPEFNRSESLRSLRLGAQADAGPSVRRREVRFGGLLLFFGMALAVAQSWAAPTLNAAFSSSGITTTVACAAGQPISTSCSKSTLVFTLTPQVGDLASSVSFTESLPANVRVATPAVKGGTCTNAVTATTAAAGSATITVASLAVPAYDPLVPGASCTVYVDVIESPGTVRNGNCATNPPAFTTTTSASPAGNITSSANVTLSGFSSCITVGTWPALESPADRQGGKLNCTANDTGLTNVNITGATTCVFNLPVTLSLTSDLAVTATSRFNFGVFIATDGGDLQKQSTAGGAVSSSPIILTTLAPPTVINSNGDACFDLASGSTATNYPLGLFTVNCLPDPTTGFLQLKTLTAWDQSSGICQSVQDTAAGTTAKCSANTSNTTIAVLGQINITKATIPPSNPTVFNYTAANTTVPASAPTPTAFTLSNGLSQQIATAQLKQAGESYLITEAADPNFTLTSIACTNAAGMPAGNVIIDLSTRTVSANMSTLNGLVNCTYTNTRKSFLTVNKVVNPASDPGVFNLTANATTVNNQGNTGTTSPIQITPGVAAPVSETAGASTSLANYTSSYACVDASTATPITSGSGTSVPGGVTAAVGQSIVCTFTNNRNPSVTVMKAVVPSSDGGLFNLSAGATTARNSSMSLRVNEESSSGSMPRVVRIRKASPSRACTSEKFPPVAALQRRMKEDSVSSIRDLLVATAVEQLALARPPPKGSPRARPLKKVD